MTAAARSAPGGWNGLTASAPTSGHFLSSGVTVLLAFSLDDDPYGGRPAVHGRTVPEAASAAGR